MGEIEDMSKKSCIIYDSWGELIANLPDEMAGQLIKQIIAYAFDMTQPPTDDPAIWAMFSMIKSKLDEDAEKYQAKVDRLKTNSERNRNDIDTISTRNRDDIGGVSESDSVSVSVKEDKDILSEQVGEVVDYLNEQLGTKYKKSKTTTSQIKARLEEGHTVDDFKTVIDKKVRSWKDDSKMSKYLRPETLFRPSHFESYLNEIESGRASPVKDISAEKHAKIHNFSGERKIDYEALGAEFANL